MFLAGPVDWNSLEALAKVISNLEIWKMLVQNTVFPLCFTALHSITGRDFQLTDSLQFHRDERSSGLLPWASTDPTAPAVTCKHLRNDVSSWPCRLEHFGGISEADIDREVETPVRFH